MKKNEKNRQILRKKRIIHKKIEKSAKKLRFARLISQNLRYSRFFMLKNEEFYKKDSRKSENGQSVDRSEHKIDRKKPQNEQRDK